MLAGPTAMPLDAVACAKARMMASGASISTLPPGPITTAELPKFRAENASPVPSTTMSMARKPTVAGRQGILPGIDCGQWSGVGSLLRSGER